jgi:hypothetical protein
MASRALDHSVRAKRLYRQALRVVRLCPWSIKDKMRMNVLDAFYLTKDLPHEKQLEYLEKGEKGIEMLHQALKTNEMHEFLYRDDG